MCIRDRNYCIPLVTEESSVVAALSNSSKFWYDRGGFKSKVLSKSDRIFSKDIKAVRDLIVTNKVFETVNKQTKISRV